MAWKLVYVLAVLSLACVSVSGGYFSRDFCEKELVCYNGFQNYMCNKQIELKPACNKGKIVRMNKDTIALLVKKHNELRNQQAIGNVTGIFRYPKANDMATMSWDDELEFLAIPVAMQCDLNHDKCHRTPRYKATGQNIGYRCRSWGITVPEAIDLTVQDWFDEYMNVTSVNEVRELHSSHTRVAIGHWTQVVQSKADRVGCAVVTYINGEMQCINIVCNYNAGNLGNYPIYNTDSHKRLCKGTNPMYPGLCSLDENFAQHPNGSDYFDVKSTEYSAVTKWIQNGKNYDMFGDNVAPESVVKIKQSSSSSSSRQSRTMTYYDSNGNIISEAEYKALLAKWNDYQNRETSTSRQMTTSSVSRTQNGFPIQSREPTRQSTNASTGSRTSRNTQFSPSRSSSRQTINPISQRQQPPQYQTKTQNNNPVRVIEYQQQRKPISNRSPSSSRLPLPIQNSNSFRTSGQPVYSVPIKFIYSNTNPNSDMKNKQFQIVTPSRSFSTT